MQSSVIQYRETGEMTDRETGRKKSALLLLVLVLTPYGVSGQPIKIFLETISDAAERTLICRETNLAGAQSDLENAVFYLNGSDIRGNLTAGEYTEEVGRITFPLTQALEGHFTCGKANSMSPNSLDLAASLTEDVDIPRYYVQPVGGSVEMMCGILQGALWSLYSTDWIFQDFKNVEKTFGERAEVRREQLRDFSLRVSRLELTDSGNYFCEVKVGPTNNLDRRESPVIILQVYQEPEIIFLSSDQFHTIHPNTTRPPSVQFNCTATGSPELQIQWYHNGNPIPSDSTDFQVPTPTTEEEVLASSLQVSDPRLGNSGEITCRASISYALAEDGKMGEEITSSRSFSRNLIILDSSLEPQPYATQDGDLLIRMDLPSGVTLPGVTQIRLKTTPLDPSGEKSLEVPVDDVFFEGSRFYAFVPASRLKFRQFHVQVALVVDGQAGPYSPANVSQLQLVDFDETSSCEKEETYLLHIVLPLAIVGLLIVLIFLLCIAMYRVSAKNKERHDKRHACDDVLEIVKRRLADEVNRDPYNEGKVDELDGMVQEILDIKKNITGYNNKECQRKAKQRCSRCKTASQYQNNATSVEMGTVRRDVKAAGEEESKVEGREDEGTEEDLVQPTEGNGVIDQVPQADGVGVIASDGPERGAATKDEGRKRTRERILAIIAGIDQELEGRNCRKKLK